jgi:hypothetical protein
MLIQWFRQWQSRLLPGKTILLIVLSGTAGAGLTVTAPSIIAWLGGGSHPSPPAPPVFDARFIPLGKAYGPELGRAYAAAWNEGAKALEAGQPVAASLKTVSDAWDTARVQLFDKLVTPEFSKIIPEGQADADALLVNRMALARAWRGFAIGLSTPGR